MFALLVLEVLMSEQLLRGPMVAGLIVLDLLGSELPVYGPCVLMLACSFEFWPWLCSLRMGDDV